VWQALHAELEPLGLTVITVAFDKTPDDARPYIEAAAPTHPSLIDTDYVLADLYNMVNVPTVLWIDEAGTIVRPNDAFFVADTYTAVTGFHPDKPIAALRAWVRGEAGALGDGIDARPPAPSLDDQLAKTHFALAWWLANAGRTDEAEPHFVRAGELAPHDFTIRRGSMLMRGKNPAGPEFFAMVADWTGSGHRYYEPLADLAPKSGRS
jgi:hypothetical protein